MASANRWFGKILLSIADLFCIAKVSGCVSVNAPAEDLSKNIEAGPRILHVHHILDFQQY